MKKFLLLLFIFCFPLTVSASPFLVCDPYPTTVVQPTYFSIVTDTGNPVQVTADSTGLTNGAVRLHCDLSTATVGQHTANVQACNQWGCSAAVAFTYTKNSPNSCTGLKLE